MGVKGAIERKFMYLFFEIMACFVWAVAFVTFIVLVVKTIKSIYHSEKPGCIMPLICLNLTNLLFGAGLGLLFWQVAALIK